MIYLVPLHPVVRDPGGAALPATGAWVSRSRYWLRRLADGSVREAPPPKAKPKKEA